MEAIQLNNVAHLHRYACGGIHVTPNPPQVGVATTIAMYLKNPGPQPLTVSRIETMVAQFGMGVAWEALPTVGPFHMPPDPEHVEEVTMLWTPLQGGHRCVRAAIHIETPPTPPHPLHIGCNLHVIQSEAERMAWQVPFHLGNPEAERMPIVLEVGSSDPSALKAHVLANGRIMRNGEPIWLEAGQEVDAQLLLLARTRDALESISTVEAYINGRFLDGIQIVVHRPALETRHHARSLERAEQAMMMDDAAVLVRR